MTEQIFDLMKPCIQNMKSPPSLKQLSLNKIAILLWSKHNCKISELFYKKFECRMITPREGWRLMTEEVEKNTSCLVIPRALRHELKRAVKVIGLQLPDFSYEFASVLRYVPGKITNLVQNLRLFCKPCGTIDKQKTIYNLLDNVVGHELDCIHLACFYLLEDHVTRLWDNLLIPQKKNVQIVFMDDSQYTYWRLFMRVGKPYNKVIIKRRVELQFINAILPDNEVAFEYYWSKMEDAARSKMIGTMIDMWNGELHLLQFMLTRIPEEQLSPWIQQKLSNILSTIAFSDKQWSNYFLSPELFGALSDDIRSAIFTPRVIRGMNACINLNKFFLLAWKASSSKWKLTRLKYYKIVTYLLEMFNCDYLDDLRVMLKDVTDEEKFGFLMQAVPDIFSAYCNNGEAEWKDFLEECLQSEANRRAFKTELSVHGIKNIKWLILKDKYKQFFQLTNISQKYVKSNLQGILYQFVSLDHEGIDLDGFLTWCLLSADEKGSVMIVIQRNDEKYLADHKECSNYHTLKARYCNRYVTIIQQPVALRQRFLQRFVSCWRFLRR